VVVLVLIARFSNPWSMIFFSALKITLTEDYSGFLLAILPPGAFLAMGLLIALKNIVDQGLEKRAMSTKTTTSVLQPAVEN
jgi:electron transport complex protein RnfE